MKPALEDSITMPQGTVTFLMSQAQAPENLNGFSEQSGIFARLQKLQVFCIEAHGGTKFAGMPNGSDSYAAFGRASDAIAAALDLHLAIATEHWSSREPPKVKIAIHTGDADLESRGGYRGHHLAQATTLLGAAHAGQILVSGPTASVIDDALPSECNLIDLGTHWLRDLQRRQRVYQLAHPELPSAFPPLGSLDTVPNNLPSELTSFVGRKEELDELLAVLSSAKIVTLSGTGGCGKTRLAIELAGTVAEEYPEGVWWVELANAQNVSDATMAALGIADTHGQSPDSRIASHLGSGKVLLILDNCEHLLGGCVEMLGSVLPRCKNLTVITTSREAIGLDEEIVWKVPPMALPSVGKDSAPPSLTAFDSVRLFIDRAVDARPNFRVSNETAPAVAEICARLDGIPLAIELAAARVRVMSVERILTGLRDRFRLLTDRSEATPARQSTLLASVEWSYDLLSGKERDLLRRLSVFAGSFDVDAVEHVCPGGNLEMIEILDLLGQLVDRSLVQFDYVHGNRYRLLETIREFAAEKRNDSGEEKYFRDRHLGYFNTLAQELEPILENQLDPSILDRFEEDRANFIAALEWSLTQNEAESALLLGVSLIPFWRFRGYYWEAETWLRRVLEAPDQTSLELRGRALFGLGLMRLTGMDVEAGFGLGDVQEALMIARSIDDRRTMSRCLAQLAFTELLLNPDDRSENLEEALSLAKEEGDVGDLIFALIAISYTHTYFQNRHNDADETIAKLRAINDELNSRWLDSVCNAMTGEADLRLGRFGDGRSHLEAALAAARDLGDPIVEMISAMSLVELEVATGHYQAAHQLVEESRDRLARSARGRLEGVELSLITGLIAEGNLDRARSIGKPVQKTIRAFGLPHYFAARVGVLMARINEQDIQEARAQCEEALQTSQMIHNPWLTSQITYELGRIAHREEHFDKAEDLHHEAMALQVTHGFKPDVLDSLDAIALLAIELESWAEGVRLISASNMARQELGSVRWALDEAEVKAGLERAREALGKQAFTKASEEGPGLSLAQAVAYASRARGERRRPSTGWASLTPTEIEVVKLATRGLTNPEIAERLFISRSTVKTHLTHIFTKLGVSTRAELAGEATRRAI